MALNVIFGRNETDCPWLTFCNKPTKCTYVQPT